MGLVNISYFKISCKSDTKHMKNNNKGFTIIEVVIRCSFGSNFDDRVLCYRQYISQCNSHRKKVELVGQLEIRIDKYMLTGNFDNSSLGDINFSKASSGSIHEFTATNNRFSIEVVKRAYASIDTELINQQLGQYMQRANEIYVNANAIVY